METSIFNGVQDSKWALVIWGVSLSNNEVLTDFYRGNPDGNLTESGYTDISPKWVNEGKNN